MTNWRTKNLEPQHAKQRESTLARRRFLTGLLGHDRDEAPMRAADLWYLIAQESLPSRAANQKLYSYWGRLKEEPPNGRGKRIAEALGWPEPKRGRPKRV